MRTLTTSALLLLMSTASADSSSSRHPRQAVGSTTGDDSACSLPGRAPACAPGACAGGVRTVECDAPECSRQLQAAFDSCCPTVRVPPRPGGRAWVTNASLCLRSNTVVVFEPGVVVEAQQPSAVGSFRRCLRA